MFESLKKMAGDLGEAFGSLSTGKKVSLALVSVGVMVGVLGISHFSSKPDYQVLFSNLSMSDSSAVTQALTESGVPFRMSKDGTSVMVPAKSVLQSRMNLATAGIPSGGSVGFEVFDKSVFGMTEFVQKLNYQRALQGELQRTINSFTEIRSSRVHISKPERRLFTKDQNEPKASVVLKMSSRRRLGKEKVMGIAHLVASAVEGLDPEKVSIIDTNGRVLYGGEAGDEMARLSSTQLEYKNSIQTGIEKRVTSMLESVVGVGKVVTRVSADIDFRRVEKTEKKYDPNSQVSRSEQRSENKSTGAQGPTGVTGTASNVPGGGQAGVTPGKPALQSNTQETINYEINEVVSHVVEATGLIKRLSIAVVIDGVHTTADDGTRSFAPRTADELKKLEKLVTNAVGIDKKRGDKIAIEGAQFDTSEKDIEIEASAGEAQEKLISDAIRYAGITALMVFLFLFVIKPLVGWITKSSEEVDALGAFPQTIEQMEEQLGIKPTGEEQLDNKTRIREILVSDPGVGAEMLREWLSSRH